jgi:hypothetical protein
MEPPVERAPAALPAGSMQMLWLENYSPNDPAGVSSSIQFDHVVAAKSWIGCLVPPEREQTLQGVGELTLQRAGH